MRGLLFVIVLASSLLLTEQVSAKEFKDVPEEFWAYEEIRWGLENEYIKGYEDGTFRPNAPLTEAQFLSMYLKAIGQSEYLSKASATHWADSFYELANRYPLPIDGYKSAFLRDKPTNRGIVAKVMASTSGVVDSLEQSVNWMYMTEITTGRSIDSTTKLEKYDAGSSLTRAQAVVFLYRYRAFDYNNRGHVFQFSGKINSSYPSGKLPPFYGSSYALEGYDRFAVAPTVDAWNGVSRFNGITSIKHVIEIPFTVRGNGYQGYTILSNTPVIGRDGTLYLTEGGILGESPEGKLYALNSDGSEKWSVTIGTSEQSPVLGSNGVIYAAGERGVFAVNADGKVLWSRKLQGFQPKVTLGKAGELIVLYTQRIPNLQENVTAFLLLDPSGRAKAHKILNNQNLSISSNIVADSNGQIYFAESTGNVYALNPVGDILWIKEIDSAIGTTIKLYNNQIYVGFAEFIDKNGVHHMGRGGILSLSHQGERLWKSPEINILQNPSIVFLDSQHIAVGGYRTVTMLDGQGGIEWQRSLNDMYPAEFMEPRYGDSYVIGDASGSLYVLWDLYSHGQLLEKLTPEGELLRGTPLDLDINQIFAGPIFNAERAIYFSGGNDVSDVFIKLSGN